jgi:HK97 family phage prohead protease
MKQDSKFERRSFKVQDLSTIREAGSDSDSKKLVGYAALFNDETIIGDMFRESLKPGAFTRAIEEKQDVRGLLNHNENYVFGRTKSGTLKLEEDEKGLRIELIPPDAQWARDIMASVERGDIDQMSFGFIPKGIEWQDGEEGELDLRVITDVDLFDISVVTYPAYVNTSVSARSADAIYNEFLASKEAQTPSEENEETNSQQAKALLRRAEIERLKD